MWPWHRKSFGNTAAAQERLQPLSEPTPHQPQQLIMLNCQHLSMVDFSIAIEAFEFNEKREKSDQKTPWNSLKDWKAKKWYPADVGVLTCEF